MESYPSCVDVISPNTDILNMTSESLKDRVDRLKDAGVFAKYWVKNWGNVARIIKTRGPKELKSRAERFEWIKRARNPNRMLARFLAGRTGLYREATGYLMNQTGRTIGSYFDNYFTMPGKTILHEDLVPAEIFKGMGLNTWMAELMGILSPVISKELGEFFIDASENAGIPSDTCSLPKVTMGMVLTNQMPPPVAIVASNMPCDSGMSSYAVMQEKFNVPIFRLDTPYNFYNERAVDYFVGELKRLIAWLEIHTPGKMDWDRMREIICERNRAVEYEMELWDLLCAKPSPMAADPVFFSHLIYICTVPGDPAGTQTFKRIVELARNNMKMGRGALKNERYRVALWNPPTLSYPDMWNWAEQAYGTAMIMDMLTYNRQPLIDPSTPETILRGLCRVIMEGPMARHTRGPSDNFFSDLFHLYERFSLDMIWMAGHVGCKNTMALNGMFREKCRERDIPLLTINYDLADSRVVSPKEIRAQVEGFMETVMKAEKNPGF